MKRIVGIRFSTTGSKRGEFMRGSESTIKRKIINMINNEPDVEYDVLIEDSGRKHIQKSIDLIGQSINIIDDKTLAEFTVDGIVIIELLGESLPQESSVKQLKKLRKRCKRTDIGDRISNEEDSANVMWFRNPIDGNIETQQDFDKKNKKFQPGWNFKNIKPFKKF